MVATVVWASPRSACSASQMSCTVASPLSQMTRRMASCSSVSWCRPGTTLEACLPDLESHELVFSLGKHFEDGPLIPALVADAYRYFARLARDFGKPAHVWLFDRYPTYSFYRFDERAVIALYSNTTAKKELPAFEVTAHGILGKFLAADMDDLRKECRKRVTQDLEVVIANAAP